LSLRVMEVVAAVRKGAGLEAVRDAAKKGMDEVCRVISTEWPREEDVAGLAVERWWCGAVFSACTDRGMSEVSRWRVVEMLAGCLGDEEGRHGGLPVRKGEG